MPGSGKLCEFCEVSDGSLHEQLEFNGAQTALAGKQMQLKPGLHPYLQPATDIGLDQTNLLTA
jgi:hypothetical protein